MSDLVKMLRARPPEAHEAFSRRTLCSEAADRIEFMGRAADALSAQIDTLEATLASVEAGINMLHRAIADRDPTKELMLRASDLAAECSRASTLPQRRKPRATLIKKALRPPPWTVTGKLAQ